MTAFVVIPVMVYLSHIAKSDVPLATTALAIYWLIIEKHKKPDNKSLDWILGFSLALALSFKHSYLFIFIPLALGYFFLEYFRGYFINTIYTSIRCLLVAIPTWCILNVGILLDIENFIDYQKIQAHMSVRTNENYSDAVYTWLNLSNHYSYGITAISTLLFLLFPVYLNSKYSTLKYRSILNVIWVALFFSILIVVGLSGTRQHSGLWLPYFVSMQLFAILVVAGLVQSKNRIRNIFGNVLFACLVAYSLFGCFRIWQQALAEPNNRLVAKYIEDNYSDKKILTAVDFPLTQHPDAVQADRKRHYSLAEKYNVEMPKESPYRKAPQPTSKKYMFRRMPGVMYGLEQIDDTSLGDSIKPYAWPIQKSEWILDYWLNQGFSVFVISDFDYFCCQIPAPAVREFSVELDNRCEVSRTFLSNKNFFLEREVSVFYCATSG